MQCFPLTLLCLWMTRLNSVYSTHSLILHPLVLDHFFSVSRPKSAFQMVSLLSRPHQNPADFFFRYFADFPYPLTFSWLLLLVGFPIDLNPRSQLLRHSCPTDVFFFWCLKKWNQTSWLSVLLSSTHTLVYATNQPASQPTPSHTHTHIVLLFLRLSLFLPFNRILGIHQSSIAGQSFVWRACVCDFRAWVIVWIRSLDLRVRSTWMQERCSDWLFGLTRATPLDWWPVFSLNDFCQTAFLPSVQFSVCTRCLFALVDSSKLVVS